MTARIALFALSLALGAVPTAGVAAPALSRLDRLVIEDDIRQQLALYALLADGDGVAPKDVGKLADQLMTADVEIDAYPADGGAPQHMSGRASLTAPKPKPDKPEPAFSRHFLVDTRFDAVTARTAKTRTTAVQFSTPPGETGARVHSWVYHFDWTKSAEVGASAAWRCGTIGEAAYLDRSSPLLMVEARKLEGRGGEGLLETNHNHGGR